MPQKITDRMAYFAKNYYQNYKNLQDEAHFDGYNYENLYKKMFSDYNSTAKLYQKMDTPPTVETDPREFEEYERAVGKLIAQTLFAMTTPDHVKSELPNTDEFSMQVNPADLFKNLDIETEDLKANFGGIDPVLAGRSPETNRYDDDEITEEEHDEILFGDDDDEPNFGTNEYDDFLEENYQKDLQKGELDNPLLGSVPDDSPLGQAFGQAFGVKTQSAKEKNIQIGEQGHIDIYRFELDENDTPEKHATKQGLNALASVLGARDINKSLTDDVLDQISKDTQEAKEAEERNNSVVDNDLRRAYERKEQKRQMTVKGGYLALRGQWEKRTVGDIFAHPFRSIKEYASYKKAEKEALKLNGETKESLDKLAGEAGRIYDFGKRVPAVNTGYTKDMEAIEAELAKTNQAVGFEKSEQEQLNEDLGNLFGNKTASINEQNKKIEQPTLTQNKDMSVGK